MGNDEVGNIPNRNVFNGAVAEARDLTSTAANHEMILIPQVLANAGAYASAEVDAAFAGAYIKAQLKIQQKSNSAYIAGAADTPVDALWPLPTGIWLPGHTYTYTVDIAGGGYYTTNQDDNADLDPILEGAEIKFVTVTVDDWANGGETAIPATVPAP